MSTSGSSSGKLVVELNQFDVVQGRGKNANNRPGNVHFRSVIAELSPRYQAAISTERRDEIAHEVIQKIRAKGGRFLQSVTAGNAKGEVVAAWETVSNEKTLAKTKQAFRDVGTARRRKSSTQNSRKEDSPKRDEEDYVSGGPYQQSSSSRVQHLPISSAYADVNRLEIYQDISQAQQIQQSTSFRPSIHEELPPNIPSHSELGSRNPYIGADWPGSSFGPPLNNPRPFLGHPPGVYTFPHPQDSSHMLPLLDQIRLQERLFREHQLRQMLGHRPFQAAASTQHHHQYHPLQAPSAASETGYSFRPSHPLESQMHAPSSDRPQHHNVRRSSFPGESLPPIQSQVHRKRSADSDPGEKSTKKPSFASATTTETIQSEHDHRRRNVTGQDPSYPEQHQYHHPSTVARKEYNLPSLPVGAPQQYGLVSQTHALHSSPSIEGPLEQRQMPPRPGASYIGSQPSSSTSESESENSGRW